MPEQYPPWGGSRRRRSTEAGTVLFRYAAGDSLASATSARSGTATYTALISDELFTYAVGDSLSAATTARSGTATYSEDI